MPPKTDSPTTLGKYTLHEEIGRGGFAIVYRATHNTLGTEAAVKVLSPGLAADEQARQRFIQEAQTASALEHPHIVRILDLDEQAGQVFIAMEYLPGGDLKARLAKGGPLAQGEALEILRQVAEALDYAHARGVLHRDVKPGNILFDQKGSIRLCDFGLVRVAEAPRLTQLGSVVGTAAYISPEQAEARPLTGRADQYSLAVLAYELLTGKTPFSGEGSTAVALMHVTKVPPPPSSLNPRVTPEMDSALLKALAKDPAGRYTSCLEFVQALEGAVGTSQRRRFRELLAEARALLEKGDFAALHTHLETLKGFETFKTSEMMDLLAELADFRNAAGHYEAMVKGWETARQNAADVLGQFPRYPDAGGVFASLGLRKPPRVRLSPRQWALQLGAGALLGLPAAFLVLYLAFRFITRP